MKKTLLLPLMILTFGFLACNKEKVTPQKNPDAAIANEQAASNGKIKNPAANIFTSCALWHITSVTAGGIDQTQNYSSVDFVFCPDNTFSASNDVMSQNGKWFFGTLNDNTTYLNLNFNNPQNPWSILQDEWKVNSFESARIVLQTEDGSKTLTLQQPAK